MRHWEALRKLGPLYKLGYFVFQPFFGPFVRQRYTGSEHVPEQGGAILAANHLSQFDPLSIAYALGMQGIEARFLAKAELFDVPVLGPLIKKWGMVPVKRGKGEGGASLAQAREALAAGQKLGIFVEGTLTRDPGYWPMKGKTGAARLALDTGVPLLPVVQWGTQNIMERYLPRIRMRPTTVQVAVLPPVDLSDLPQDSSDRAAVQEATRRLSQALRAGLSEIRAEDAPEEAISIEDGLDKRSLAKLSKWRRQLGRASRRQEILTD